MFALQTGVSGKMLRGGSLIAERSRLRHLVRVAKTLSKIDAARRQLLAAIHLHWYLNEPLAVYTLASNAWELCDALLKKVGKQRFVDAVRQTGGQPERTLRDLINEPRNFIKHADRDHDASLEDLQADNVDTVLMIACLDYMVLVQRQPMIFDMFLSWYSALYPEKMGQFYRENADRIFPGLAKLDRAEQLVAARFVANQLNGSAEAREADMTDDHRWAELRNWSARGV